MPSPTARLHAAFPLLRDRVEGRYGIPVRILDVPDPFAGDLDGAEIHLDYASADDLQVFTLAHLFGHTVQWSLSSPERSFQAAGFFLAIASSPGNCQHQLQLRLFPQ